MTDNPKDKSGEPTACFPGDLSKISKPVIIKKEQALTAEKASSMSPPAQEEDVSTELERLGARKDQGILTAEEYAAQKAKLLGI